jgi:hypothetical protein
MPDHTGTDADATDPDRAASAHLAEKEHREAVPSAEPSTAAESGRDVRVTPLDPVKAATELLGAVAGIGALIFFVGSSILALRYDGLGLPPLRAATAVTREYAFGIGAQALAVWGVCAAAIAYLPGRWIYDRHLGTTPKVLWGWLLTLVAICVVLLMTLHRWFPLALVVALAWEVAALSLIRRRLLRTLATVSAVGLAVIAYEADRVNYVLDRAFVEVKSRRDSANLTGLPDKQKQVKNPDRFCVQGHYIICGPLLGWRDGGLLLGAAGDEYRPPRIMFLPASRIVNVYVEKAHAHLTDDLRNRRRTPLRCRAPLAALDLPGCGES